MKNFAPYQAIHNFLSAKDFSRSLLMNISREFYGETFIDLLCSKELSLKIISDREWNSHSFLLLFGSLLFVLKTLSESLDAQSRLARLVLGDN